MALGLAPHFQRVSAQDPSKKMVDIGLQPPSPASPIHYSVGSVEDMSFLPPSSVDLVIAGQAAHWFDHAKSWPELSRVLRPGGTVAYVGYGELFFPAHSRASEIFADMMRRVDFKPYWSQPGRGIVEGLLDAVPFPVTPALGSETEALLAQIPDLEGAGTPIADRIQEPSLGEDVKGLWDPSTAVRIKRSTTEEWTLKRRWNSQRLDAYIRTSSAYHAYATANPDDTARKGHGKDGDIVDRRVAQIGEVLRADGVGEGAEVDVAWPLVVMMIKRSV